MAEVNRQPITAAAIEVAPLLPTGAARAERAKQLDALRAIAVVGVVMYHQFPENALPGANYILDLSSIRVHFFFVLSGYLITSQLIRVRQRFAHAQKWIGSALRQFFVKRALRLMPALYLAIGIAALLDLDRMREEFLWHVLHLSNLLFAFNEGSFVESSAWHLWSLSVEWQFYFVVPLVIFLLPIRLLAPFFVLMIAVGMYSWSHINQLPDVLQSTMLAESADSLGFGGLMATLLLQGHKLKWLRFAAIAALPIIIAGFLLGARIHESTFDALIMPMHEATNILFAALVFEASIGIRGIIGKVLDLAPLQYIGRLSYGIFIYHVFIFNIYTKYCQYCSSAVRQPGWEQFISVLIASIGFAALSWHVVEQPINNLRRFLKPLPVQPAPDARPIEHSGISDHRHSDRRTVTGAL